MDHTPSLDAFLDGEHLLKTALRAAEAGGRVLMDGFGRLTEGQITLKGFGDWVTDLDHASEAEILRILRETFPNHALHAEESGRSASPTDAEWVVDPLDGTTNFVQGIPWFSVTVAFRHRGRVHTGVVHDPCRGETFWAQAGRGAFLNGRTIRVSTKETLDTAVLATGFPWRTKPYLAPYLRSFAALFSRCAGIRRMGSAALDLAYTACGRFDGFWEMKLKPWDIAAGVLIVEEAGGKVTDFVGGQSFFESGNVVAAPPALHPFLVAVTRETLHEIP